MSPGKMHSGRSAVGGNSPASGACWPKYPTSHPRYFLAPPHTWLPWWKRGNEGGKQGRSRKPLGSWVSRTPWRDAPRECKGARIVLWMGYCTVNHTQCILLDYLWNLFVYHYIILSCMGYCNCFIVTTMARIGMMMDLSKKGPMITTTDDRGVIICI